MDRVLSARVDEAVLDELERVVRKRGMTKKKFLETAIHALAEALQAEGNSDIWSETLGAWARKESPVRTRERSRRAFEKAMHRHHR